MSSKKIKIKRIRNSFTGVDFHSLPRLLKCHRVSWIECKVAQLAPIILNVKTCEDSFLHQPRERQQNTHASLLSVGHQPAALQPLVDPLPDVKSYLKKNASNITSEDANLLGPFFRYVSLRLLLQSRLFWANQAEWFCGCCCCRCCCCLPYGQKRAVNLGRSPRPQTPLPRCYFEWMWSYLRRQ